MCIAEEPGDPEDEFEEIVVDPVPPGFAGASAQAGAPPSTSSQVVHEERDDNGQYIYRPSFTDPPVDESELDEDGFTAQDRADLAALRATYTIASRTSGRPYRPGRETGGCCSWRREGLCH